jgi:hypothetical protein
MSSLRYYSNNIKTIRAKAREYYFSINHGFKAVVKGDSQNRVILP